MTDNSRRPKGRDSVLSPLNAAIDGLSLAKELSSITPGPSLGCFGSVGVLFITIRVGPLLFCDEVSQVHTYQDTSANEQYYVELGLSCADTCKALDR